MLVLLLHIRRCALRQEVVEGVAIVGHLAINLQDRQAKLQNHKVMKDLLIALHASQWCDAMRPADYQPRAQHRRQFQKV